MGTTTINAWETGQRSPSPRLLAAVADALEITVADPVPVPQRRLVLADLRHQSGLSQRATAEATGLSPSMYQAIESGYRAPDQAQRARLADHLGVSDDDFAAVWERTRRPTALGPRRSSLAYRFDSPKTFEFDTRLFRLTQGY